MYARLKTVDGSVYGYARSLRTPGSPVQIMEAMTNRGEGRQENSEPSNKLDVRRTYVTLSAEVGTRSSQPLRQHRCSPVGQQKGTKTTARSHNMGQGEGTTPKQESRHRCYKKNVRENRPPGPCHQSEHEAESPTTQAAGGRTERQNAQGSCLYPLPVPPCFPPCLPQPLDALWARQRQRNRSYIAPPTR